MDEWLVVLPHSKKITGSNPGLVLGTFYVKLTFSPREFSRVPSHSRHTWGCLQTQSSLKHRCVISVGLTWTETNKVLRLNGSNSVCESDRVRVESVGFMLLNPTVRRSAAAPTSGHMTLPLPLIGLLFQVCLFVCCFLVVVFADDLDFVHLWFWTCNLFSWILFWYSGHHKSRKKW